MKIEKLGHGHDVSGFDCGSEALNHFLKRFALAGQLANASQTYVATDNDEVIGFYTLVVGEVQHGAAPDRLKKGLPRHPVPVMVLARLAIAAGRQGQGLGQWLLKDVIIRTLQAADIAGIRALVVHAKDEAAKSYYLRFRFTEGFDNPLHLFILIKDLKGLVTK
ncbi:MAG: GNAT family N-acetyltransferase [Alphaproteobacteria bacterium]|nr:GNAT family N-acetyltransferase [Alphaproteobacteria bacterium]